MSMELMKRAAAAQALTLVQPGMKLGLGTGSTARHFVDLLGEKVAAGLKVVGVPTSEATHRQAESLSIPLATLDELGALDMTIDGADEIDPDLNLIKGGGGAHLREKIVASASRTMVVIADHSKIVQRLGAFPLPLEIVGFGRSATLRKIENVFSDQGLAPQLKLRVGRDGAPYRTDEGNLIIDAHFGAGVITNPGLLGAALAQIPGMVEHGLFVGLCSAAYVASETGVVRLDGRA